MWSLWSLLLLLLLLLLVLLLLLLSRLQEMEATDVGPGRVPRMVTGHLPMYDPSARSLLTSNELIIVSRRLRWNCTKILWTLAFPVTS